MRPFMTRTAAALFMALVLGSTASIAYAAPAIDDNGAKELKKTVDDALHYYITTSKKGGNSVETGAVSVATKGSFYEVKIPDIKVVSSDNTVDIGTVTINATPNDKGEYLTSMALPPVIHWLNKDGKPLMDLKTGAQKFAGVFMPALQTFSTVNAEYSNLELTGRSENDNPFTLKIGSLKNILNLSENSDKTWSGYNDATAKDMELTAGGGEKRALRVTVGDLSTKAFYDKMNLALAKQNRDKVQALYEGGKTPTQEELQRAGNDLVKNTFNLLDSVNNKFELNDFSFNTTPAPSAASPKADNPDVPVEKPVSVNIGHIESSFDARGVMQDKGNLSLKTTLNKISTVNTFTGFENITPRDMNFEFYFDSIPMKQITAMLSDMFGAMSESALLDGKNAKPEDMAAKKKQDENRMQDMVSTLPGLLVKSGSSFSVRNTYIDSPDLLSTLEGKFVAQAAAPGTPALPATGTMTLSVQGLDETIQSMQTQMNTTENKQELATTAQSLALFQMFGQPNKAANGKSLRVYKLDLTPDGKVLLNGNDLGGGGLGGLGLPGTP